MLRGFQVGSALALAMSLTGCPGGTDTGGTKRDHRLTPPIRLGRELINASLVFPVFLTSAPGDTQNLYVVEKGGVVKVVDSVSKAVVRVFIDISGRVSNGSEQGLLGLAFDPAYATSGEFYLSYTNTVGDSVIARYRRSTVNPNVGDPASEVVVLFVDQPFANHNGGMIAFGPADGYLYIGLGDGGSGNDPGNRAQNMNELLGKLLRIDVRTQPYTVPADNPFVMQMGARPEIWSLGLRNPWRFSFDRTLRDLYIGDVGQNAVEEINVATVGNGAGRGARLRVENQGGNVLHQSWARKLRRYRPPGSNRRVSAFKRRLFGYWRLRLPWRRDSALRGTYFYADFCAAFVRSFRLDNGMATEQSDWPSLFTSPPSRSRVLARTRPASSTSSPNRAGCTATIPELNARSARWHFILAPTHRA